MRKKISLLLITLLLCFCCSCSKEPKLEVKYLDKSSIEVLNVGEIEVTGIRLIIDEYFSDIDSLPIGEKIVLFPKDFHKFKTNEVYDEAYFNSNISVFANVKEERRAAISFCPYEPICEDPSGLYFTGDSFYSIRFYKYYNQGKFTVKNSRGFKLDTDSVLSDGDFFFDKENNKLILKTYGNSIWEGYYDGISLELNRTTDLNNIWEISSLSLSPYYGTPIEENLTSEEQTIDYESAVLLSICQNFSIDDAVIEYAKIYHEAEYYKYYKDEFAWHDFYPQIKEEYLNKLENLDNKFSMRFEWNLDDYNFDTEAFNINFMTTNLRGELSDYVSLMESRVFNEVEDNTSLSLSYLEQNFNIIDTSLTLCIEGSMWGSKSVQFDIPMKKNEAQEFLNNRKNESGETDKSVFVIVYYEVPKEYAKLTWDNSLTGKFYKIEVYDSKEDMNLLRKAELTKKK